jgi:hypothetical protein
MAEQQIPRVTLVRAHRQAIYEEIESIFHLSTDLPLYLKSAGADVSDREWVKDYAQVLAVCGRVLDQLGWSEQDDHDGYELELDAGTIELMRRLGRNALAGLEESRENLANGGRSKYYYRSEAELAEELAAARRLVDLDLDGLDAARLASAAVHEAVA